MSAPPGTSTEQRQRLIGKLDSLARHAESERVTQQELEYLKQEHAEAQSSLSFALRKSGRQSEELRGLEQENFELRRRVGPSSSGADPLGSMSAASTVAAAKAAAANRTQKHLLGQISDMRAQEVKMREELSQARRAQAAERGANEEAELQRRRARRDQRDRRERERRHPRSKSSDVRRARHRRSRVRGRRAGGGVGGGVGGGGGGGGGGGEDDADTSDQAADE